MGGNVVIRVDGVSIRIVDGNITFERTRTEALAASTAEGFAAKRAQGHDLPAADFRTLNGAVPVSAANGTAEASVSGIVDDSGLGAEEIACITDPPPGGPRAKPAWSAEDVERLRALYPTHSASAIAAELRRPFNSVRSIVRPAAEGSIRIQQGSAR